MNIFVKNTKDLKIDDLLNILRERIRVFVIEQNCVYEEIDKNDNNAIHVVFYDQDKIIAYSRIIEHETFYSFGRVLVVNKYRKKGLGKKVVSRTLREIKKLQNENSIKKIPIKIQAQAYLENFYKTFGFVSKSDIYLEDDIPHLDMEK
jgi:ElaA protein